LMQQSVDDVVEKRYQKIMSFGIFAEEATK